MKDERREELSIENSIDRLAAAIEKLASAVSAPVVAAAPVSQAVLTEQPVEVEAKKPRGRPKKQGNIEIVSQEGVTVETKSLIPDRALSSDGKTEIVLVSEGIGADGIPETNYELRPTSAAADPAAETAAPATAESNLTKTEIVQILTGLQVHLEKTAKGVEEKRAAAQRCRDLIKSVVGTESLKDAKPEHFARIKSAVQKVLNNE